MGFLKKKRRTENGSNVNGLPCLVSTKPASIKMGKLSERLLPKWESGSWNIQRKSG